MPLVLTRKPGTAIVIGDIRIEFREQHKVAIEAPPEKRILREELLAREKAA